jgi:hypothetical protein
MYPSRLQRPTISTVAQVHFVLKGTRLIGPGALARFIIKPEPRFITMVLIYIMQVLDDDSGSARLSKSAITSVFKYQNGKCCLELLESRVWDIVRLGTKQTDPLEELGTY